jgi:hypothetical protein
MRISTNDRVRVDNSVLIGEDTSSEILKIDLMDNTRARRNDSEVLKSVLSPLKELETLLVVVEF